MVKRVGFLFLGVIFLFSLNGCATTRKQKELEAQGLRNQILVLENQLQGKDQEILALQDSLNKASVEKEQITEASAAKKKMAGEIKSRPKIRDIQVALQNAGYDPGPIDGQMGKKTREAIRTFQRNNDLGVDGKVGKRTWAVLREYLAKRVK